jgi:hypothetical protein
MAKNYMGENFTLNKVLLAIHRKQKNESLADTAGRLIIDRFESNLLKFSMGSDGIIVYSLYNKGNWDKVKSIRWDLTKDFLGEQKKETIAEILKLINKDF